MMLRFVLFLEELYLQGRDTYTVGRKENSVDCKAPDPLAAG